MKNLQALTQYTILPRPMSAAWESALWEDFFDVDVDEEEEPPLDAELDDLARGSK